MAEWFYREAGEIDVPSEDFWLELYCGGALIKPAKAFVANVASVRAVWKIHPHLVEQAVINVALLCEEVWRVTGKPLFTGEEANVVELSEQVTRTIRERFEKRYAETGSVEKAAGYDFARGLERFEALLRINTNPDLEAAVFATLAGQITWGLTAFETLAADVWEQAVKRRSDLSKHKVSLQSQLGLQKAFKNLGSAEIDGILSDPAIRKVVLVRNVIVHNAAEVDQTFINEASVIHWPVEDQIGHRILLDGKRVRDLVNPVVGLGLSLLKAAVRWFKF